MLHVNNLLRNNVFIQNPETNHHEFFRTFEKAGAMEKADFSGAMTRLIERCTTTPIPPTTLIILLISGLLSLINNFASR